VITRDDECITLTAKMAARLNTIGCHRDARAI
jgi:hypothetical protein